MNRERRSSSWLTGLALMFLFALVIRQSAHAADTGRLAGTVFESYCDCGRQLTRGASGVKLLLGDAEATLTADDGSYAFRDIVSGTYTFGAFVDGFGEARSEVTIAPSETSILDLDLPFSVPGEIIIGFVDGTTREDVEALASSYGVTLMSYSGWWSLVRIPRGFYTADFIVAFQAEPIVRNAERNAYLCPAACPTGRAANAAVAEEE
jgi:hypothetical protein